MSKGTLNSAIINSFNSEFEWHCMSLLTDACASVQSNHCIDTDCKEEYISAVLFDHIDKSPQAAEWHIDIAPKYRKYVQAVLRKKKVKNIVSEISIQYGGWTNSADLEYFVAAQNVVEFIPPEKKKSRNPNPVIISDYHKRYIAIVDSFLSDKRRGCMIGYILQGDTKYTVNCINHYLCDSNRVPEILKKRAVKLNGFDACYVSVRKNRSMKHLMFNFSINNNKTNYNQNDE
ncbi:MAG: hypothetical protein LBH60_02415 [Prevotellaceae bacterium]|jgi:hypothetical protein|nr:hypothetical protein [Prevotellaceae bacterium]